MRTVTAGRTLWVVWCEGGRRNADQPSRLHGFAEGKFEQMLADTSLCGSWDSSRKKVGKGGKDHRSGEWSS